MRIVCGLKFNKKQTKLEGIKEVESKKSFWWNTLFWILDLALFFLWKITSLTKSKRQINYLKVAELATWSDQNADETVESTK